MEIHIKILIPKFSIGERSMKMHLTKFKILDKTPQKVHQKQLIRETVISNHIYSATLSIKRSTFSGYSIYANSYSYMLYFLPSSLVNIVKLVSSSASCCKYSK